MIHVMTRAHGRHCGLVRGGGGRRLAGVLQPGNQLSVDWTGRLEQHLGTFKVELSNARAAPLLDDRKRLAALSAACALCEVALPEREPHGPLYDALLILLEALADDDLTWPMVYLRWELGLLAELGFGLDLDACALTGATEGLAYVSPRSGRAATAEAAGLHRHKLLALPGFFVGERGVGPSDDAADDIRAGFALTGHFLERWLFDGGPAKMPAARQRLAANFASAPTRSGGI
ncbi:DNA repair protein RecO [Oceanibacterium hippocampi]|uniref:DNA repair protein RecO n=1 Tax=Oceanibacterium hippocampi TaxID=745714 RepID=A0A1Y5SNP3_9PROT|nr:DNA repair protein RecO [Oceanibacterium hippocampi]